MQLEISVPGKAFLAGEYLVLRQPLAAILAVEPRFKLTWKKNRNSVTAPKSPFHPASPAGLLWQKAVGPHLSKWLGYEAHFFDPHQGQGGWGGSTAEYLLVWALGQHLRGESPVVTVRLAELIREQYRREFRDHNPEGELPSGADLAAQLLGQILWMNSNLQPAAWNWPQVGFYLAKTPFKIETHQHLAELASFSVTDLAKAFQQIEAAVSHRRPEEFLDGIRTWSRVQGALGLVAPETQEILNTLASLGPFVAAKGCGALGADVIAVFEAKGPGHAEGSVAKMLDQSNCRVMATENSLSNGLDMRMVSSE